MTTEETNRLVPFSHPELLVLRFAVSFLDIAQGEGAFVLNFLSAVLLSELETEIKRREGEDT